VEPHKDPLALLSLLLLQCTELKIILAIRCMRLISCSCVGIALHPFRVPQTKINSLLKITDNQLKI